MTTITDSEASGAATESAAGGGEGRCEVELPQFEGPLDLLLHLVRRHELDILDIPIAFVCEKYLEYLEFMRALDLEAAGEYLVMAATLAYLKSRELVPQQPEDAEVAKTLSEDGGDPRTELIARLLEYQSYRDAASRLDLLPLSGRDVFDRGSVVDVPPLDSGLAPITLYRLAEAYQRVLERARVLKSHEVVLERVSVASRMKHLTGLLIERSSFDFEQIFLERSWTSEQELRAMLIVTLMSVLELVRLGVARVHQPEGSDTLLIERAATAEEAERALAGYDEAVSFGRPAAPEVEADIRDTAVQDDLAFGAVAGELDDAALLEEARRLEQEHARSWAAPEPLDDVADELDARAELVLDDELTVHADPLRAEPAMPRSVDRGGELDDDDGDDDVGAGLDDDALDDELETVAAPSSNDATASLPLDDETPAPAEHDAPARTAAPAELPVETPAANEAEAANEPVVANAAEAANEPAAANTATGDREGLSREDAPGVEEDESP